MRCFKCGNELTTGDTRLICLSCRQKNEQEYHWKITPLTGWICPRCGTVHSPFVTQCHCPPVFIVTSEYESPFNEEDKK